MRMRATIVFYYEVDPEDYPGAETGHDMAALDAESLCKDPLTLAEMMTGAGYTLEIGRWP